MKLSSPLFGLMNQAGESLMSFSIERYNNFQCEHSFPAFLDDIRRSITHPDASQDCQWFIRKSYEADGVLKFPFDVCRSEKGIQMLYGEILIFIGATPRDIIDIMKLFERGKLGAFKRKLGSFMREVKEARPVFISDRNDEGLVVLIKTVKVGPRYMIYIGNHELEAYPGPIQYTRDPIEAIEIYLALCEKQKSYPLGYLIGSKKDKDQEGS